MTPDAGRLLDEYSADHRHPFNQLTHSICVPLIAASVIGLLWAIPVPAAFAVGGGWLNWGTLVLAGVLLYYLRLAPGLAAGMAVGALAACAGMAALDGLAMPLWRIAATVFVIGWIGQFVGHYVEGRRPSFFRDLRFLLIGPLWVLAKLYRRLGIRL